MARGDAVSEQTEVAGHSRALTIIAVLLILGALKWSAPVTMPLAFAIVLIALCWPIRQGLRRHLPEPLSFFGAALALLLILGLFAACLYVTAQSLIDGLPRYEEDLRRLLDQGRQWLEARGLPAPREVADEQMLGRMAERLALQAWSGMGTLVFVLALAILGLPAVPQMHRAVVRLWDHSKRGREVIQTSRIAATKIQSYLATATLTSAITGVLSGLLALAVGLDFAFLWGLLAFVLNYIPTVGSVIAVIPPTLFALFQFQELVTPLVVLGGLTVVQIGMGSFVYPTLAGRALEVLPVVLLFSLALWSFIWGVPGALLATPLTVTIMIALREVDRARWLPELLSHQPEPEAGRPSIGNRIKAALSSAP